VTNETKGKIYIDPSKLTVPAAPAPASTGGGGAGQKPPAPPSVAAPEPPRPPGAKANALLRHSIRDEAERLLARATKPIPLIGMFILVGQLFMLYAAPGSGKTLLMIWLIREAIRDGRIDPERLIFINADDNNHGVAEKNALLAEVGAHTVVPTYKGFKPSQFVDKLKETISDGSASGLIVVIDTLKKFTNLMDKAMVTDFAQVCREFVLAGGTLIALGHTTKNPFPDGTPKYQGTTDILEDFDAVYVGKPFDGGPGSNERVIQLERIKARGDSPLKVGYAFSIEEGLTYEQKLNSVRELYPEELDGRAREAMVAADEEVAAQIRGYLASGHGHVGKDHMVKVIARAEGFPRAQVERVLNRYTGPDPAVHLWDFTEGDRRKRTYFLLALRDG
jgi:hypothetical protein